MKMKLKTLLLLLCWVIFSTGTVSAEMSKPKVHMQTSLGLIVIELDAKAAPKTVANFLQYAKSDFFNQTIFHRVIKGFMIQGGGLTPDMQKKKTSAPIVIEADNGLKNVRGSIAMARASPARFFMPPLMAEGKNSSKPPSPTSSSLIFVIMSMVDGSSRVCSRKGSATLSSSDIELKSADP